ncbi:hypothetical protein JCM9534A_17310 [Catenuloplanes indicus JCM 9534]
MAYESAGVVLASSGPRAVTGMIRVLQASYRKMLGVVHRGCSRRERSPGAVAPIVMGVGSGAVKGGRWVAGSQAVTYLLSAAVVLGLAASAAAGDVLGLVNTAPPTAQVAPAPAPGTPVVTVLRQDPSSTRTAPADGAVSRPQASRPSVTAPPRPSPRRSPRRR